MLTRNSIFHHFSMVNNNFWHNYQEFRLEQGLLKSGSQPLSAANDWNLVKFEKWIGKLIEGILLKLLILWVRKRLNFYYFFISCKTKMYNWVFCLLNFHIFISFWQIRHLENEGRKVTIPNFALWIMRDIDQLSTPSFPIGLVKIQSGLLLDQLRLA